MQQLGMLSFTTTVPVPRNLIMNSDVHTLSTSETVMKQYFLSFACILNKRYNSPHSNIR